LLAERLRRRIKNSFTDWCDHALAPLGQSLAENHRLLIRYLDAVSRGELDRLMVFMPPGTAKSTYVSVLFPAWFMARRTERHRSIAHRDAGRIVQPASDGEGA
jgi:hypothetical protein